MAKHHKRIHNGKDRRTGRKVTERHKFARDRKGNNSRPTLKITKPNPAAPVRGVRDRKCCETPEKRDEVNKRLFAEITNVTWDNVWSKNEGRWRKVIPQWFVTKYRAHMPHFRGYLREQGL